MSVKTVGSNHDVKLSQSMFKWHQIANMTSERDREKTGKQNVENCIGVDLLEAEQFALAN